jgi:ribosome-associated translation inhibitor RaiA
MSCLLLGLIGSASQQARAADEPKRPVAVGLAQFNSEISVLRENLSRSVTSLEAVKAAAANNEDLSKPFAAFDSAYKELETQITKVREHGTAAKARAKEHWETWQKELTSMQNAKLRSKAQERYTAASGEFEKITDKVDAAKEGFAPLTADLKDVHTYLSTDLSKDAVSSLSNTIWKMGKQARSVDGKLGDVMKQIERTIGKLPQT